MVVALVGCGGHRPSRENAPPGVLSRDSVCRLVTDIAPLTTFFGEMPPSVSERDAFNAALRFLVAAGVAGVDQQDPGAHTIVTRPFGGQTWLSTCPVNHYFVYALRIVVAGQRMIVDMDCRESVGWEGGVVHGVAMPRDRGELHACDDPRYVSKNDALIPSQIFQGTMEMLRLTAAP